MNNSNIKGNSLLKKLVIGILIILAVPLILEGLLSFFYHQSFSFIDYSSQVILTAFLVFYAVLIYIGQSSRYSTYLRKIVVGVLIFLGLALIYEGVRNCSVSGSSFMTPAAIVLLALLILCLVLIHKVTRRLFRTFIYLFTSFIIVASSYVAIVLDVETANEKERKERILAMQEAKSDTDTDSGDDRMLAIGTRISNLQLNSGATSSTPRQAQDDTAESTPANTKSDSNNSIENTNEMWRIAANAYNEKDYATAYKYANTLYDKRTVDGTWLLGKLYLDGLGVHQDEERGIKLIRMAALRGHPGAQFDLGKYIWWNCPIDDEESKKESFEWIRKAAEKNHAPAQAWLGHEYEIGLYVEQDLLAAAEWYEKAANNGSEFAKEALERIWKEIDELLNDLNDF